MSYIDLSCPVEIFRTVLPTEETPAASLTLFNLSDRVISSVEVLLRLLDEDNRETERLTFRGRALNGRPHSTFLMTVPCAASEELKTLEATVEKVWYADNETWRRNPANAVEYTTNALPLSPALTNLKFAAGETAVGYPCMQDGLWLCVCGRPNPEDDAFCARCGRNRDMVFSRFSPETVEAQISMKERQLDLNSRNMREDTIRLQRIREAEYMQKKSRRHTRLRLLAAAAAAIALTAGVLLYGSPWLHLLAARRALNTGDPTGAKAVFEALGDFGNAQDMIAECDWKLALDAADNAHTADELAQASALLRAIPDRPEATDKANETDLLRGSLLQGNGYWKDALEVLSLLPEDYNGRKELEDKCLTTKAIALQSEGQYAEARKIWLSLTDQPGAKEQAAACIYEPAKALMAEGNWDDAISMLSEIPDYHDSREKTLECHYHKAEEMLEAGDVQGASNEFLLAGSWSDAPERCKSLTYDQAEELYNAGKYRDAQSLYASIPDYQDANRKEQACRYQLAGKAADDQEYSMALDLLEGIPDDFEKTGELRAKAAYNKAKSAMRQENWTTAAELLGSLNRNELRRTYRDIETRYREACEKAGIDPYPETPVPESTESAAIPATPAPSPEKPVSVPTPDASVNPFLVTEDEEP